MLDVSRILAHVTHDERRHAHHHKKTQRFELSGYNWTPDFNSGEARTQSELW